MYPVGEGLHLLYEAGARRIRNPHHQVLPYFAVRGGRGCERKMGGGGGRMNGGGMKRKRGVEGGRKGMEGGEGRRRKEDG